MNHSPPDETATPEHDLSHFVDVILEIERPSTEELAPYSRGERHRRLRANTEAHRAQLQHWIERQRLEKEVVRVGPATGFNLLFVTCTPHAAQALAHAPGVVEVLFDADANGRVITH